MKAGGRLSSEFNSLPAALEAELQANAKSIVDDTIETIYNYNTYGNKYALIGKDSGSERSVMGQVSDVSLHNHPSTAENIGFFSSTDLQTVKTSNALEMRIVTRDFLTKKAYVYRIQKNNKSKPWPDMKKIDYEIGLAALKQYSGRLGRSDLNHYMTEALHNVAGSIFKKYGINYSRTRIG